MPAITEQPACEEWLGHLVECLPKPTGGRLRNKNEWPRVTSLELPKDAHNTSDRWLALKRVSDMTHVKVGWFDSHCSHEFFTALCLPDADFNNLLATLQVIAKLN